MSAGNMVRVLRLMSEKGASDVYLSASSPILIKINGQLLQLSDQPLTHTQPRQLLAELLTPSQLEELEDTGELNIGVGLAGFRSFRPPGLTPPGPHPPRVRRTPSEAPPPPRPPPPSPPPPPGTPRRCRLPASPALRPGSSGRTRTRRSVVSTADRSACSSHTCTSGRARSGSPR